MTDNKPTNKYHKRIKGGLVGLLGFLFVVVLIVYQSKDDSHETGDVENTANQIEAISDSDKNSEPELDGNESNTVHQQSSPVISNPQQDVTLSAEETAAVNKLSQYIESKKIIFVSDQQKAEWLKDYNDKNLISVLKAEILKKAHLNEDLQVKENAVEFLIDAMQAQSEVAATAVIEIIQSGIVEENNLPMDYKEYVGGLTGELMFHYLAYWPMGETHLQQTLPGPVSQNIFNNVVALKNENLKESLHESLTDSQR